MGKIHNANILKNKMDIDTYSGTIQNTMRRMTVGRKQFSDNL